MALTPTVKPPSVPRPNITVPPPAKLQEMMLEDIDEHKARRIVIVGPSGAGKTWLASTWPSPAIADVDRNIYTLKQKSYHLYAGTKPGDKQIIIAQPRDIKDPNTGLVTKAVGFWDMIAKFNEWDERPDIETIIGDSMSKMSALASSLGVHVAGLEKLSQTEKEGKGKLKVNLMVLGDYKAEMNLMEQLLDQLGDLSKTVIFTAHSRSEKNDKGALIHYNPLITGEAMRAGFGRWFTDVWWLHVEGTGENAKRVLLCQQDNLRPFVKNTMDLPARIENPTYKKIMQLAGKVV